MIMKKYKHKKTGFIAELASHGNDYNLVLDGEVQGMLPKWVVENSNDWEEVKSEYPKILEFSDGFNKYYKKSDGKFTINLQYDYSEEDLLKSKTLTITKIQTSETDIWTVGETVKNPFFNTPMLKSENIRVERFILHPDTTFTVWLKSSITEALGSIAISKLEKAKPPLFVTEDGVNIFEGDDYWVVHHDFTYSIFKGGNQPRMPALQLFSTKKAAENYIGENKPKFSKSQITDILNVWLTDSYKTQIGLYDQIKGKLGI